MSDPRPTVTERNGNRYAPFIYITAHDDAGARAAAEAAGCAAFFCKTERGADVLDAIRRVARNRPT